MHIAIAQPRNPWTQHPRPIDRKVNIFNWGVGVAQKWWKIGVSRYCYAYMVCLTYLKMITNKMMKIVLKMKITLQGSSGFPQVHLSAKSEFFPQLLFAAPEDWEQFIFYHWSWVAHRQIDPKLLCSLCHCSEGCESLCFLIAKFVLMFLIVIHPTFEIRFDLPLCTQSSPSVTTSQTGPWKIQLQLLQYLLHKYLGFIICAMHWVTRSLRMHFQKLEFFKF